MSGEMTAERLSEIRKRCEAATFGPWEHQTRRSNWNTKGLETFGGREIHDDLAVEHQVVTEWIHGQAHDKVAIVGIAVSPYRETMHHVYVRAEDAEFVAHARRDVPDLLAALAAETERADRLQEAANAMQDALLAYRFPAGDDPATVDAQAKAAMDRWEALLPDAAREG